MMQSTPYVLAVVIFALIHGTVSLISHNMFKKSGRGMNPDTQNTNALITMLLFGIVLLLSRETNLWLAGVLAFTYLLRLLYSIKNHLGMYSWYKSQVRRSRVRYQQTGQKSDLTIEGYQNLATLQLSVVVSLLGIAAMILVIYYVFTFDPSAMLTAQSDSDFLELQQSLKHDL